ncbi:MAG: ankyrin [Acidobacteria bacterium OLB17]|nr:MAG: ankyrin [Acidobacteria bacterium OLB17]
MQAVVNEDEACLVLLLDAGYSPASGFDGGLVQSPVFVAMTKDSFRMTYLLLTHGLSVRSATVIDSMFFAASNRKNGALKAFLSAGVPVNITDRSGQTALMGAAAIGDNESLRILLAAGADPNATSNAGLTSLMVAQGDDARFQLLFDAGARMDAVDKKGFTALHYAVQRQDVPKTRFLVEHGATVQIRDKDGRTALDFARSLPPSEVRAKLISLFDH